MEPGGGSSCFNSNASRSIAQYSDSKESIPQHSRDGSSASETLLPPAKQPQGSKWGIYWFTQVSILFLLVLGVATAISHHRFYQSLHGTRAGKAYKQQWVIRIGAGFAIIFRATLVAMMGISRRQWIWVSLQKSFISLAGINAIFGITSDPLYFFNLDMILRAPCSTLMAIFMWVLPLTAMLTLDSITVQPGPGYAKHTAPCNAITAHLDFDTTPSTIPIPMDGTTLREIAYRYRDTYQSPSPYASNLYTVTALTGHLPGMVFDGCPITAAWCGYNISLVSTAVHCTREEYPIVSESDWKMPDKWMSLFNDTIIDDEIPVFLAQRDRDNSNTLWIAHVATNTTWGGLYPTLICCRNSVSRYHLQTQAAGFNAPADQLGQKSLQGSEHLDFVEDVAPLAEPTMYDVSFAYFDVFTDLLGGSILRNHDYHMHSYDPDDFVNSTKIKHTRILSLLDGFLEELFNYNTTFLYNVLRVTATAMSLALVTRRDHVFSAAIPTTCEIWEPYNIYIYSPRKLVITYASIAGLSIIIAGLGFAALVMNGVARDASFSTMLLTTRNPSLDRLAEGHSIGKMPLPDELGKRMMMFGEVGTIGPDGVGHTALGLEGEVRPMTKGGSYL